MALNVWDAFGAVQRPVTSGPADAAPGAREWQRTASTAAASTREDALGAAIQFRSMIGLRGGRNIGRKASQPGDLPP
jgi:hypothetical protein